MLTQLTDRDVQLIAGVLSQADMFFAKRGGPLADETRKVFRDIARAFIDGEILTAEQKIIVCAAISAQIRAIQQASLNGQTLAIAELQMLVNKLETS